MLIDLRETPNFVILNMNFIPLFRMNGRKIVKMTLRIAFLTMAVVAGFALLYFGMAWCFSRITIPAEEGAPKEVTIFVKTNGAHTDIVMPVRNEVKDWSLEMPFSNNISQDTVYSYVALGWGDKGFFLDMPTWDDLTLRLAFNAAFGFNSTAMHATYYKYLEDDDSCRRIVISREQYARLVDFVSGRFKRCPGGRFINIKTDAAYGLTDAFYEARGRYHLFYTCNTWVNHALAVCGQKRCLWTIFDKGIFLKYR